ncbi:phosphonate metabolism protein/1,5-bisphosphokinase (PRPP-forming) PhnN [Burkholderia contaminans]|uniref:Ribose 1,5-bisphosphate phosphokinase PhnN n=1 Tax=Burkholderia contaminans TaxID=488447 RepID=A0A3N8PTM0_9BURK|nr:phosphonate metabolism protein/1,5-bisphosphokinase (PRPP-forming) PhnN [Burkholderia contaminans]RQT14957.1 phosphonate metabolism protein/1,5-bisphosphokinase (PRPP-forming) PhnN [Burkholderia contaminans]
MTRNAAKLGRLVVVVGPSGAGKDTLLDYARARLMGTPTVRFVRRVITRPLSIGEVHEAVGADEFVRRVNEGAFSLWWHAHGLSYGLPSSIEEWIAAGDVVVANVSRAIVPTARERFPDVSVISVGATYEVLAARLAARGREDAEAIAARLTRGGAVGVDGLGVISIDNSGNIERAGEKLVSILSAGGHVGIS